MRKLSVFLVQSVVLMCLFQAIGLAAHAADIIARGDSFNQSCVMARFDASDKAARQCDGKVIENFDLGTCSATYGGYNVTVKTYCSDPKRATQYALVGYTKGMNCSEAQANLNDISDNGCQTDTMVSPAAKIVQIGTDEIGHQQCMKFYKMICLGPWTRKNSRE